MLWQQWAAHGGRVGGGPGEGAVRWLRPILGAALVAAAVAALVIGEVGWIQGLRALAVVLLFAGGAALLALPWLLGIFRDLATERRERLHDQVRADIAVQVHDSVLQTLTLIQANASDSAQVTRLARAEERRLRSWLYDPVGDAHATLGASLAHAAAEVESDHGAAIDVVRVGEAPMNDTLEAVVAAAREAMINAAKHAGPNPKVSVYCELTDGLVEVFIRDRGPGFDPDTVPADRHGVRESIIARMQRAGGTAEVASSDRGTEVRLVAKAGSWT
jgi:signal transduction histidine kinase